MSLGFQNVSFEIVAAVDNWKPSISVYRANFNGHPIFEIDLSQDIDYQIFKNFEPDCIIGGPPCQDFSSAGKRDENNGKGDLTISFAYIVKEIEPEWFVMENVERIQKTNKLKDAIAIFKSCGYGLSSQVLDASYYGVPQARKRFFLVGHLHSEDNFFDKYLLKTQSKQSMTVFDYLGHSLGIECYYRHPRSYARRGVFSIYEPSPTIRGVNRPIPKGYVPHEGDVCKPTDNNVRPLTTIERAYIQTFPKDFQWFGTKTDLEQMIGNAVPVNLATHVAQCIKDYMRDLEMGKVKKQEQQLAFAF